ncbi:MAG: hypothetical protein U0R80_04940 [Nocardioidaceae bacterium]
MAWEHDLFALLDDLEAQAEAAFDAERGDELADRSRAEYATVSWASRLMASVGRTVTVSVTGVGPLTGRLARVGEGWALLAGAGQDWMVPWSAVQVLEGASTRSVPELAWSPVSRLGLGSALRRLAETDRACLVHLRDESRLEARVTRVGRDFVELVVGEGREVLVPFDRLAAVSSRD